MKQEYWMPLKSEEGLNFLCDHLGDAQDIMEEMWKLLVKLDPTLPAEGYTNNDDI